MMMGLFVLQTQFTNKSSHNTV